MKNISTLTLDGVGTFRYSERIGSPQESFSGDTFRAKRIFDVPYKARWAFIQYMVGDAFIGSGGSIRRILPDQYYAQWGASNQSALANKAFLVCTGVESIEPLGQQYENYTNFGPGTKITFASYDFARITLTYNSVTYDLLSDTSMGGVSEYECLRFVSVFRQPTAEFLTLPMGAFKWVEMDSFTGKVKLDPVTKKPAGIRVTGSNGKIVSAAEIIMVHHQVPGIPPAIKTHIGCVNKYDWVAMRAKAGQLLLTNAEIKPYKWLDGRRLYDITYKFKFLDPDPEGTLDNPLSPRGHNWFLQFYPVDVNTVANAKDLIEGMPEYKLITHDGTPEGRRVYESADMYYLFEKLDPDLVDIPIVV